MSNDLQLISGVFLEQLPKSHEYLIPYFKEPVSRSFLLYYARFGHMLSSGTKFYYNIFCQHTGIICDYRFFQRLIKRIKSIEAALAAANLAFDIEAVSDIKSGKMRLR